MADSAKSALGWKSLAKRLYICFQGFVYPLRVFLPMLKYSVFGLKILCRMSLFLFPLFNACVWMWKGKGKQRGCYGNRTQQEGGQAECGWSDAPAAGIQGVHSHPEHSWGMNSTSSALYIPIYLITSLFTSVTIVQKLARLSVELSLWDFLSQILQIHL